MKPSDDQFPRVKVTETKRETKTTKDTGLYVRITTTKTRKRLPQRYLVGGGCRYEPPEETLNRIERVLREAIDKTPRWPLHMLESADDLLLEIEQARSFRKAGELDLFGACCLRIGSVWEVLRVSEVEEEFAKRRRSVEATRGPRNRDSVWLKLEPHFREYERTGRRMTAGKLWQIFKIKYPKESAKTQEGSFKSFYYSKAQEWRISTKVKA